jgi:VCBS repeat-containing protein
VREQVVTIGPGVNGIADFANNYRANEIHGIVYDDTNDNQILDSQEHRHVGVSIYIDLDRDEIYDADEPITVTADDGSYVFTGLVPGAYVVRERDGYEGRPNNPAHTGGVLWPAGTSNPAQGNVDPRSITVALNKGETHYQTVSLTLPNAGSISNMVDVFLLFDDTGSFTANSPIVRAAFPTIISTLQASLPGVDLGFGVGRFEEYANFAAEFASGRPFTLNQPIIAASTPGFSAAIQSALDRTAPGYGGDAPETDIEALYQLVTGRGFDGNNNGTVRDSGIAGLVSTQINPGPSGDVPDFASFVADSANGVLAPAGNVGGGGFRSGALPIILLATDTGFAFQPMGETTITGVGGLTLPLSALTQTSRGSTPFNYGAGIQQTITALNALGALVVGLGTNPQATIDPRQDLEAISQLTGAINRTATTIANGTADAIAPGDPLYFQIGTGFGGTVADGVVNAIQNAATNVAMDITVRASDPRVQVINTTGVLQAIASGQTASFNIEFTGDNRPHRFDLQFIREGTDVVLGSIPVVIGVNIVGDGYNYDELEDGEIHHSSHFANYVANVAPSFVAGADITVTENAGSQSFAAWATEIAAGPITEALQTVDFQVSVDKASLFSVAPTIDATGTLTFAPAPNAFGTAVVTVLAHDNGGIGLSGVDTSSARTFVITITPTDSAPIANDDVYSVVSGQTLTVAAAGLLSNDVDLDGDVLTAVLVDAPAHGMVQLQADGSFIYTPDAGYIGRDRFSYAAFDGIANSNLAAVNIDILSTNHAPIANGDSLTTNQDTALTIASSSLLANDVDLDGDALAITILTAPSNGTLSLTADGNYLYTPNAGFSGFDSFDYLVNDGTLNSNATGVQIQVVHVNHAPVATADAFSTAEDTTLTTISVLANDSDVDGDALQAVLVSGPAHGTLTFNTNGTFVYRPDANYNGPDSFSYKVADGISESNVVAVSLNIIAVNDAPVALGDTLSATEDTTLTISAAALLGNDSDVEGDPLSITALTAPLRGRVLLNADGTISYTPNANFNGTDSFTYRASDGSLTSLPVTITISVAAVNDAPVAAADSFSMTQDTILASPARGVLVNDSDLDGDVLAAILGTGPEHGVLTLNSDGSFSYVPTPGYTGPDSFAYRASDRSLLSALTTVTITIIPAPPATKFFVVDTDSQSTFQYSASGDSLSNSALDKADSKPRGIASNAAGTTQWVINSSGTVYIYDNNGVSLGSWTALNLGKPEGIAVWGNDVWIVDANADRVSKFVGGANLRSGKVSANSSFALNAGNLDSTDIVTDGAHLWVTNDTLTADKVFRYTTAGVLEGSWTLPASNPTPTGITLDPANVNHLWVVDASTDKVYQYDGATARLSGAQEASITFALAATNTNAQGIADPLPLLAASSAPELKTDDSLHRSALHQAIASFERRGFEPLKLKGSDDSRSATTLTVKSRIDDSHPSAIAGVNITSSTSKHHQPKVDSVRDLWESLFAEWESNDHGSHGFKS